MSQQFSRNGSVLSPGLFLVQRFAPEYTTLSPGATRLSFSFPATERVEEGLLCDKLHHAATRLSDDERATCYYGLHRQLR
ncbi:hypothetical protein GKZ68_09660 [Hymenobacter sp. BRD128]|uniref:hypothetical protein n=1 Tax=Hymenobacter sp. BRD128 TaxID=2675878 RepID=UPI0015655085|nr:hypothetical protein [Hymenobacter sp. BRD128]QKG56867.1 hypothetical protein GKZ68_09660 [Hymenobacter sp. BRD128]